MLEIQRLLLSNTQTQAWELLSAMGIYPHQHPRFPELWQFTYDQIDSDAYRAHPIVCESRGLILNSQDWSVVAFPFKRFFNWGETSAQTIDWNSARIQNKVDGSLLIQYYYAGEWHVATKGTPDADCPIGKNPIAFKELFWRTRHRQGFDVANLRIGWTYCWELTSDLNRVVTSQLNNPGTLTLLAVRDAAQEEHDVLEFSKCFPVVEHFDFSTYEEIATAAQTLDPIKQEGFVVVDSYFNRVKIKSPRYVQIHRLKDSVTTTRIVELIQQGESSEVLAYFPDLQKIYNDTSARFEELAIFLDSEYQRVCGVAGLDRESRKTFALTVQSQIQSNWHGAMFELLKLHQGVKNHSQFGMARQFLCANRAEKTAELLEAFNYDINT